MPLTYDFLNLHVNIFLIIYCFSRHTFKNREVANLLWAVAKLKLPTQSENTLEYTSELLRNDVTDCIRNRSIEGSEYVKLEGVLTVRSDVPASLHLFVGLVTIER